MFNAKKYLSNNKKKKKLLTILEKNHVLELWYFVEDYNTMKKEKDIEILSVLILDMYCKYISDKAIYQINISGEQTEFIDKKMLENPLDTNLFDELYHYVLRMLHENINPLPSKKKKFFSQIKEKIYSYSFDINGTKKENIQKKTKSSFF